MKIIGLSGGSGSGKGFVSSLFLKNHNIPAIDTDKVYHNLTSSLTPCLVELVSEFGAEILTKDSSLDRKKLFDIVFFGDDAKEKQERLNKIAHKFVREKTLEIIEEKKAEGYSAVIIDAPLLFESDFDKLCDLVIAVVADKETRIERIIKRDNIEREKALRRIDSQLPDTVLSEKADYVIDNSGDVSQTENQIKKIINKINI